MKKVLLIRLSSLGDIILISPVAEALKQNGNYKIDLLTKAIYGKIGRLIPGISEVFSYEGDLKKCIVQLKRMKYDVIIDLQKNPRSLFISMALNPKIVAGYPKRRLRRGLAASRLNVKPESPHIIDSYLQSLKRLNVVPSTSVPHLDVPQTVAEEADRFFNSRFKGKLVIGLAPGSKHREKKWPGYGDLAALIMSNTDASVIVFATSEDDLGFVSAIDSKRIILAVDLPLDLLAGVMAKCSLVVANDSGLMHMASALQVPVIGVFGPTNPVLGFAPRGNLVRIICDDVRCSPCSLHGEKRCRMPRKYCFENITAGRIFNEISDLLNANQGSVILPKTR